MRLVMWILLVGACALPPAVEVWAVLETSGRVAMLLATALWVPAMYRLHGSGGAGPALPAAVLSFAVVVIAGWWLVGPLFLALPYGLGVRVAAALVQPLGAGNNEPVYVFVLTLACGAQVMAVAWLLATLPRKLVST